MKHFISNIIPALLLLAAACACTDGLDIRQSYEYSIETLPLPKSLEKGETVALEFSIVREGYYTGTNYKFRYFQPEGKGKLTGYYGDDIPVNRFQHILSDNFVLYYESRCEEQQQLDFVFEDNFGQRVEYSITFGNRKPDDEPGDDTPSDEGNDPDPDDDDPSDEPDNTPENPQPDPNDNEPDDEPGDDTPSDKGNDPDPNDDDPGDEPGNTPENPHPDPNDNEPDDEPGDNTPFNEDNPNPDDGDPKEEEPDDGTSPDDNETVPDDTPGTPEDKTGTGSDPNGNPDGGTLSGEETETNVTSEKKAVNREHE
jgi:hypothetical protein